VPPVVVPVVAVSLILTLLLDGEGWMTVSVVLSWSAMLSSGATGAPSGISSFGWVWSLIHCINVWFVAQQ